MYKVQVYLPIEALEDVKKAVETAGGGHIGNYAGCMSWWKVRSAWTTLEGAHPYYGIVGQRSESEEIILQFRCDEEHIHAVLDGIYKVHPYEEPVIDVVKLENI
jgi:hypothetical protein